MKINQAGFILWGVLCLFLSRVVVANELVSVTFENLTSYPTAIHVEGTQKPYASLNPKEKISLQSYPANRWLFKQEIERGKWKVIDEFIAGDDDHQSHQIHPANALNKRIFKGVEIAFYLEGSDDQALVWSKQINPRNPSQVRYGLETRPVGSNLYQWIVHEGLSGEGWSFELKGDGRFLSVGEQAATIITKPESELGKKNLSFRLIPSPQNWSEGMCLESIAMPGTVFNQNTANKTLFFGSPRNERTRVPMSFIPIPFGEHASLAKITTLRNQDFWNWLKHESPEIPPQRYVVEDSLKDGFVGEALPVEMHSITGYNVLRLNPFNLEDHALKSSAGANIFTRLDPNKPGTYYLDNNMRVPLMFYYVPQKEGRASGSTHTYFSDNEMQKSMSISVSVQGKAGNPKKAGAGLGMSGSYSEVRREAQSQNRVARLRVKWASDFWLILDKTNLRLSPSFSSYLLRMNNNYDAFKEMFNLFGTHYPLSVLYGGRALQESYLEGSSFANELSKEYTASRDQEGSYKGVGGSANAKVSFGTKVASNTKTEASFTKDWTNGGTSNDYDSWQKGEAKNYVPIKVDLRPIYEVLRPELIDNINAAGALKIHALRRQAYSMLDRYLKEEGQMIASEGEKKPLLFEAWVESIEATSQNDAYNVDFTKAFAPDLYGSLKISYMNNALLDEPTVALNIPEAEPQTLIESGKINIPAKNPEGNSNRHVFGVLPVVKKTQQGKHTVYHSNYDLSNQYVWFILELYDKDGQLGEDLLDQQSDRIQFDNKDTTAMVKLEDVVNESTKLLTKTFTAEHENAGEFNIKIHVRALDYGTQNPGKDELNFPDFPRYRE